MPTVLITGGSGLIGMRLTTLLLEKRYAITHLSRNSCLTGKVKTYIWDIKNKFIDKEAIETADYIIHLAGAGIADKRWSAKRKQETIESRTESAKLLYDKIKFSQKKPKAFISTSGIGYYGAVTTQNIFNEIDPPGKDFLSECCIKWENASQPIETLGIRRVVVRTGVVLSDKGGALQKMARPVKCFMGAPLGSGDQFMPWIHIDDLCAMYIKAIEDDGMKGIYNAVAPEHITNKEFTKLLARILKKPLFLPAIPALIMKIIFGEMAVILLEGSRVDSSKIINSEFNFKYSEVEPALKQCFKI